LPQKEIMCKDILKVSFIGILLTFSIQIFAERPNVDGFDFKGTYYFNSHSTKASRGYSQFCDATTIPFSIAIPCAMVIGGWIAHDETVLREALGVAIGTVVSAGALYTTKKIFNRHRPYETYPEQINPMEYEWSSSFPSGHTGMAFSTATSLTMAFPKWYVGVPVYLWATSVGISRLEAGVHYPTDVIAGAVLGTGCAVASYYINRAIWQSVDKKKELKALENYPK
jgi:membrane-associated phospholipid phosphatase